ncbi:putative 3-oxo-5-alpha-steroid 4-dehydrogenase [Lyophyllum shimeji]|uniref:3-oxo-5-alpha-steroid 4-dehydrogenase n=1 Tax=Lyophyllum shimeji TaxID=47721 RepID=A0A9P3Q069_LYOSH|nr:putative 3-oxo-5-alpha-steroid 4-dehydrogenase [Lyophyllum shimeji]
MATTVTLTISSVNKPPPFARGLPITLDCDADTTVADVKQLVATKFPKFYAARQKLTKKGDKANLDDSKKIAEVVGPQGGELQVKDLGPQISWRTVFLIEYAGPIVIHPLVYHFPRLWYGQDVQHSDLQKLVYAMTLIHFIKRELETLFVHRFSHGTMPFRNVFKNSAHYHLLSGLALAYDVYRPKFSATSPYIRGTIRDNKNFLWLCIAIWAFAELANLHTHLTLRALRPPGTRVRAIPYGFGFSFLSCPNYFFETLAWAVISVMTGSVAAGVFTVVATAQMAVWALKKHRNYKKEFGKEYPRGRYAMIPPRSLIPIPPGLLFLQPCLANAGNFGCSNGGTFAVETPLSVYGYDHLPPLTDISSRLLLAALAVVPYVAASPGSLDKVREDGKAMDKIVHVTGADKFCMIMPRDAHTNIGDSEHPGGMKSYCSRAGRYSSEQGELHDEFWSDVAFKKGKGKNGGRFAQLTGCIRPEHLDRLNPDDSGGQYDSSGGDGGRGNPEGSKCLGYNHYVELVEPAGPRACIRCCDDPADCPTDKDTQGCPKVIPGNYFDCD